MVTNKTIAQSDILDAKTMLDLARIEGDRLKIDLREAALNDLLERYGYHSCHGSQTKGAAMSESDETTTTDEPTEEPAPEPAPEPNPEPDDEPSHPDATPAE